MGIEPYGRFKGPRQPGADYFDDYMENNDVGIFNGSDGFQSYDSLRARLGSEGDQINMLCRSCGRRTVVTVTFPELIAIAHSMAPEGWKPSEENGTIYPELVHDCGEKMSPPHYTPDEARKKIVLAAENGWISGEDVQRQEARIMQMKRSMGYGG